MMKKSMSCNVAILCASITELTDVSHYCNPATAKSRIKPDRLIIRHGQHFFRLSSSVNLASIRFVSKIGYKGSDFKIWKTRVVTLFGFERIAINTAISCDTELRPKAVFKIGGHRVSKPSRTLVYHCSLILSEIDSPRFVMAFDLAGGSIDDKTRR